MSTKKLQIIGGGLGGGSSVQIDSTLTQSGKAADAKATGDAIIAHKTDQNMHVTTEEKASLLEAIGNIHEHSNKEVLDKIESAVDIYTSETEPVNAKDGSLWINMNSASGAPAIYVCRNGVWEMLSDGKPQAQADWNEVDGLEPSYIRNKPFGYKEDLYANSALPFSLGNNSIYKGKMNNSTELSNAINAGDEVTVIWDSQTYNLVAKSVSAEFSSGSHWTIGNALGNGRLITDANDCTNAETDSGEPFAILPVLGEIYTRSTLANHSVIIKAKNNIIKLDPKFLPDEAVAPKIQFITWEADD